MTPRAHPPALAAVRSLSFPAWHQLPHKDEPAWQQEVLTYLCRAHLHLPRPSGRQVIRDQASWMQACKHTWWPGLGCLAPWPRTAIAPPYGEPSPGPTGPRDGGPVTEASSSSTEGLPRSRPLSVLTPAG